MDKYLTAFQYFIKYDKAFVEDLDTRYHRTIISLIQLLEKQDSNIIVNYLSAEEFIDFLDGNGFYIDTTSDLAKSWQRVNPSIVILVPEYTREYEIGGRKVTITLKINLKDEEEQSLSSIYYEEPYTNEWEPTQNPLGSRVLNIQITLEVGTADARPPP